MATILDLGLFRGFVDIFIWLLLFLIVYGALEVTNTFKNKGLHALFAFTITAVLVLTGSVGISIVTSMAPAVVVIAAFFFFMLLLAGFAGADTKDLPSIFAKKSVIWIVFIPLIFILIISWTQPSREKTAVSAETGEVAAVEAAPQQPSLFSSVVSNPKVLGLLLIMSISAMTLAMMTGGGALGGH